MVDEDVKEDIMKKLFETDVLAPEMSLVPEDEFESIFEEKDVIEQFDNIADAYHKMWYLLEEGKKSVNDIVEAFEKIDQREIRSSSDELVDTVLDGLVLALALDWEARKQLPDEEDVEEWF